MTTRRPYIIALSLLAVLDIAAGFWYFANHVNADGRSGGLLWDDGADSEAVMADTLASAMASNRFEPMTDRVACYTSAFSLPTGKGKGSPFTCIKQVKLRMPKTVNGSAELGDLRQAIADKAFGHSGESLGKDIDAFVGAAEFNLGGNSDYTQSPSVTTRSVVGREHRVKAFPYSTSERLLQYEVYSYVYDGYRRSERVGFVLYDRARHRVLGTADVFRPTESGRLLELINKRIAKVARKKGQKLNAAATVAAEFMVERRGISMVYAEGGIASPESGVSYVFLPYSELGLCLTDEFKRLLDGDCGYQHYTPMKF